MTEEQGERERLVDVILTAVGEETFTRFKEFMASRDLKGIEDHIGHRVIALLANDESLAHALFAAGFVAGSETTLGYVEQAAHLHSAMHTKEHTPRRNVPRA
jgi:hypothetical protein